MLLSKLIVKRFMTAVCCAWRSLAFRTVLFQHFSPTSSFTRFCTTGTSGTYSGCPIRFRTTHSWTICRDWDCDEEESTFGRQGFKWIQMWLLWNTCDYDRSYLCCRGSEGRIFLFQIVQQNFDKNEQFLSACYIVTIAHLRYLMNSSFCSFLATSKFDFWHDDWCFRSTWWHNVCSRFVLWQLCGCEASLWWQPKSRSSEKTA